MTKLNTNIDYTTFFGAALGFDDKILRKRGLTFTRLLNISCLVESIVLNSNIYFELGNTPIWEPYRDAIEKTDLYKILVPPKKIFNTIEEPIDNDDKVLFETLKIVVKEIKQVEMQFLQYAVNFRGGIYSALTEFPKLKSFNDYTNNSFIDRYLLIVNELFDDNEKKEFIKAVKLLEKNNVGLLGLHVLVRTKLWSDYRTKKNNSIYAPHFSRQPYIYSTLGEANKIDINEWSMSKIREYGNNIKRDIFNLKQSEIEPYLSPIFVTCLKNAKKPIDIIENAIKIRDHKYAKMYRNETEKIITEQLNGNVDYLNEYKINLYGKIHDLNEFLYSQGKSRQINTDYIFSFPNNFPFSWQKTFSKTKKVSQQKGESSSYLLSDILKQSLAIYDVSKKISEIFKQNYKFDTSILAINKTNA